MRRRGSEERAPLEAQPSGDWLLSPRIGLLQDQPCGLHHAGKRLLCERWEEKTHLGGHSSSSAPTHFSFALDTSGACQKASCLGTLVPMTRAQLPSLPGALPHFNSSRFGGEAQCTEPSLTCLIPRSFRSTAAAASPGRHRQLRPAGPPLTARLLLPPLTLLNPSLLNAALLGCFVGWSGVGRGDKLFFLKNDALGHRAL